MLVTPSPDFRYMLGYDAPPLERLTCLIVRPGSGPTLVLPHLEEPLARHELGALDDEIELRTWEETEDPFALVAEVLGRPGRVGQVHSRGLSAGGFLRDGRRSRRQGPE